MNKILYAAMCIHCFITPMPFRSTFVYLHITLQLQLILYREDFIGKKTLQFIVIYQKYQNFLRKYFVIQTSQLFYLNIATFWTYLSAGICWGAQDHVSSKFYLSEVVCSACIVRLRSEKYPSKLLKIEVLRLHLRAVMPNSISIQLIISFQSENQCLT